MELVVAWIWVLGILGLLVCVVTYLNRASWGLSWRWALAGTAVIFAAAILQALARAR